MHGQQNVKIWDDKSFQLYVPVTLYQQGNSLVVISVRGWVSFTATECGQKKWVTWKFPWTLQGIERVTSRLVEQCFNQPWHTPPTIPSECNNYLKLPAKIMCCSTLTHWVNYGLCTVNVSLVYCIFILAIILLNTDLTLGYLLIHFQMQLFCSDLCC